MDNAHLIPDILLHIPSFADKKTICQLMQTCRALNHYGAKDLLACYISLNTGSKQAVLSFLQFLARDIPYRLSHFRTLQLTRSASSLCPTAEAEEVGRLLESLFILLARSGSLQSLNIDYVEVILDLETSDLSGAISMVGTLKSLHLSIVGHRAANMLMMSRSSLEDADISMDEQYQDDGDLEHGEESELFRLDSRKLSHLLHGSRHSLRFLTVCGNGLGGAHVGPRYPRLARLVHLFPDTLCMRNYVHAFPNLQDLVVSFSFDDFDLSTWDEFEQLRSENVHEQADYAAWSSLWLFDGSIATLFLLAPLCHIHALELTDEQNLSEQASKELDMLRSCVDIARPRHISLTSYSGRWLFDTAFLSTWTRPALQSLVHIELVLSLCPNYGDGQNTGPEVDLARGLDNVVVHIVSVVRSLYSFSLSLDAAPERDPSPIAARPLGALEQTLAEWDLDAFARRVRAAGAVGPLESVAIRLRRHRTRVEQTVQLGPVYTLGELRSVGADVE
ncbi:hypothetical protein TRAPUB_5062 [Trametes pubescens]|uniref:F-box domain-containing protein n=1 Tax=Trametes pubescens TaxID=154538 RepID=A0A1M2W750_TRAPU|nr:hypothetical protein TRAPUB_5062 [Trametes pubescens]